MIPILVQAGTRKQHLDISSRKKPTFASTHCFAALALFYHSTFCAYPYRDNPAFFAL